MIAWLVACAAPPEVTILAAASLTEAFTDLEPVFEAEHPGVDVVLSFAGSQALAAQVRAGARADVFASADRAQAEALAVEGLVDAPAVIAHNRLVLVFPAGRPTHPLADLGHVERLVVGTAEVPVGAYTDALFAAGAASYGPAWGDAVTAAIVSREPDVRQVLAKVQLGEADAAVVYQTDAAAADGVVAVPIPDGLVDDATYTQAAVRAAPHPDLATAWTALVLGDAGRRALAARGFGLP